ncbi:MAG: PTS sugar transporter subunit IIA [Myxococcales bacterium]|nr:PTS sugar transporter subunit IIA [Myxococcales bacterium]MCB9701758.1 PTS sugar transporter subunit IIA [Myxococcales bacterium]
MPTDPDRLLTLRELADYLRLGERTVLKLAQQGEVPAARIGNQWRFKQGVIDAWLDDQMLGVRGGRRPDPDELASFSIDTCFAADHVLPELEGGTRAAVLEELARAAHALELVRDPTWFLGALLERENILTSAVGEGVAFPHTLHRHPEQVSRPFILLGRARAGVDFLAPDGAPVHLVVLMGLRYQELHLPWLARLSALLRERPLRQALIDAEPAAIYPMIRERLAELG